MNLFFLSSSETGQNFADGNLEGLQELAIDRPEGVRRNNGATKTGVKSFSTFVEKTGYKLEDGVIRRRIGCLDLVEYFRGNNNLFYSFQQYQQIKESSDYLEVKCTKLVGFGPDESRDTMGKYLVFVSPWRSSILEDDPFVNLGLEPRNCKPTKHQAVKE